MYSLSYLLLQKLAQLCLTQCSTFLCTFSSYQAAQSQLVSHLIMQRLFGDRVFTCLATIIQCMSAFVVIWLTLMNLIKREPVAKTSAARACALESSWSLMYQTVPVENECKPSWNTLRDLRRRRYLTSSAALPCSTPPPGPSHRWAVQSRESVVEQENTKEKSNRFFTLKLLKVTRIGRQPRISGPVVNRANCSKWRKVASQDLKV